MSKLEWRYSKGEVSEGTLSEVERVLNITFPKFYRNVIRSFNGARPKPPLMVQLDKQVITIRSFLAVGKVYPDNIISVNKRLEDLLPNKVVAFANDDFGNYFCFDFRNRGVGQVVFWNHENGDLVDVDEAFRDYILQ
ncbi:SMI1/KNR4 family protein [Bacillus sp. FJAT-45066]|uniref:SMI1/KNR4 family protein n=1 Tax=Bacillus sp. FJAT-45066 TaxID=2011010 RepID=UPI0015965AA6|nr:SMI1/KNR4 family protein [Bacillus sp. FJAT-45066]